MKSQMKRCIAMLVLLCLVLPFVPNLPAANAVSVSDTLAQKHYSSYVNWAMVYDQNSCYSMQGMTVNNTYVYCAKTGSNDAKAIVTRIDKSSGSKTLMTNCGSDTFTLSFTVNRADFPLPEGRCRIYLENVSATDVAAKASTATMENPEIFLVFVAQTNDTRYNSYSVLRPLSAADVLEAQKAEQAESE